MVSCSVRRLRVSIRKALNSTNCQEHRAAYPCLSAPSAISISRITWTDTENLLSRQSWQRWTAEEEEGTSLKRLIKLTSRSDNSRVACLFARIRCGLCGSKPAADSFFGAKLLALVLKSKLKWHASFGVSGGCVKGMLLSQSWL